METQSVKVRFAPAPTGMMHLGNIRTALMNYLYARAHDGTFVLRIEDTDPERNFDPGGVIIRDDLAWLDITYDEGPGVGGHNAPYLQSERSDLYEDVRQQLEEKGEIYRCFCTTEELDKKRERQRALRLPPRYDRTCANLSEEEIQKQLEHGAAFVWRLRLNHDKVITITDLARGTITFELKNFSDFPITRQNGTFTFMFANFVDDMLMGITHVLRGEDHLTNTAGQAALFDALDKPMPIFWHMPILCNIDGKKLSKRDFGFSLRDLKEAGFLPEAIDNYLATIGSSFAEEIMPLKQLATQVKFGQSAAAQIKYDVDKLKWFNHQWIISYPPEKLAQACRSFVEARYPDAKKTEDARLAELLQTIKSDLTTLADSANALAFVFNTPQPSEADVRACISPEHRATIAQIVSNHLDNIADANTFAAAIKKDAKEQGVPLKELFWFVRLALTGKTNGPAIGDLIVMLNANESRKRITWTLESLGRVG